MRFEIAAPEIDDIDALIKQDADDFFGFLALEVESGLKSPQSYWPVDTGDSKRRFRADRNSREILIGNDAPYAAAVNYKQRYKKAGANPNYLAVERTVEAFMPQWEARANRRLGGAN